MTNSDWWWCYIDAHCGSLLGILPNLNKNDYKLIIVSATAILKSFGCDLEEESSFQLSHTPHISRGVIEYEPEIP